MSDTFNNMQQTAFSSKSNKSVGDVQYHVFGMIDFNEWQTEKFEEITSSRYEEQEMWFHSEVGDHPNIKHVQQHWVNNVETILSLERSYMKEGYEGAMVLPDIPYFKGKKSNKLMKFKTMESQDCEIIGVYEGQGKYVGSLGGLRLLQEDGVTNCDCGSGFSDQDREWIWDNSSSVIGRVAEIKYQELTDDGVMRFPIFLRYRGDKE